MGLDETGANWDADLRDDEVFSEDGGWELQCAQIKGGQTEDQARPGRRSYPAVTATMTVRMVIVSPRAIVATLVPRPIAGSLAPWSLLIVAVFAALVTLGPLQNKINPRWDLVSRLLLATIELLLLEAVLMPAVSERSTITNCRRLAIFFDVAWWLLPAV